MDYSRKKIIDEIIDSKRLSFLSISRKGRLLHRPLKTIFFYFLILLNQYTPIKIKIRAKTIFGDDLRGYSSAAIGPIYYLGFQDPELTIFLIKNLKPGDVFLDVGSNIGYYSLLAKNLVGREGKIYSFEPTPRIYALLRKNTESFPNIYTVPVALWNKSGVLDFVDYGSRFDVFNTFFKRELDFLKGKGKILKIRTETLDNFCKEHEIEPAFVKMDAEGAETLILEGASGLLNKHRPLILLEVGWGKEWEPSPKKAFEILFRSRYGVFELDNEGNVASHRLKEDYEYSNLIFIPEEKSKNFLEKI